MKRVRGRFWTVATTLGFPLLEFGMERLVRADEPVPENDSGWISSPSPFCAALCAF